MDLTAARHPWLGRDTSTERRTAQMASGAYIRPRAGARIGMTPSTPAATCMAAYRPTILRRRVSPNCPTPCTASRPVISRMPGTTVTVSASDSPMRNDSTASRRATSPRLVRSTTPPTDWLSGRHVAGPVFAIAGVMSQVLSAWVDTSSRFQRPRRSQHIVHECRRVLRSRTSTVRRRERNVSHLNHGHRGSIGIGCRVTQVDRPAGLPSLHVLLLPAKDEPYVAAGVPVAIDG